MDMSKNRLFFHVFSKFLIIWNIKIHQELFIVHGSALFRSNTLILIIILLHLHDGLKTSFSMEVIN